VPKPDARKGSQPELFLDRGLGRRIVANALRAEGMTVHVMEDVFGGDDPEWRLDEVWIPEVTRRGWVILMKDDKVRMKPRERDALVGSGARVFCVTNAQLTGDQMAERLVVNLERIVRRSETPGPYIYGVYRDGLRKLFPREEAVS
jgi:hypothetical protein